MKKLILYLVFSGLLVACKSTSIFQSKEEAILAYKNAVKDASKPIPTKIYKNLRVISSDNPEITKKNIGNDTYVLMVAWKVAADTIYYHNKENGFYNTGSRDLWLTTTQDFKSFVSRKRNFRKNESKHLRFQQLLGLPPDKEQIVPRVFIEFWVRPQDMFRPCPDAEITDKQCECTEIANQSKQEHQIWIDAYRKKSYENENPYYTFPWTQLGYTYDWNPRNKKHIGLSEFVVNKNANIIIHKIYSTETYR
ncbi:MAG: hypothetical protein SFU27_07745 [Thermonemataceae bacterium]|nr:hypothetical protein [Thermonemataceae bacterium]